MVNVDTVYQKVLALANKEQRGYVTPQEFNLLADKAQLELVNNYFHAMKMAYIKPKNQTESYDQTEMLRDKLSFIRQQETDLTTTDSTGGLYSTLDLPTNSYLVNTIVADDSIEIVEVDRHNLINIINNPLTKPTASRPVYVRQTSELNNAVSTISIQIYPMLSSAIISIDHLIRPSIPKWGYVVVNEKPLYNANTSNHFSLHPSEEEPLVTKILQLIGIIIEKPDLQQAALIDRQTIRQEQNS